MSKLEAIIFDLEGVIIDSESIWDKETKEFLARRSFGYEREVIKPLMMGKRLVEGAKILQEHYGFYGNPEKLASERREIAKKLFETEILFIPGFPEFFGRILGSYKTAIATSLEKDFLVGVVEKLSLARLFGNHIYSIAEVGYLSKPNPDIFLYAARKLNTEPSCCLVIEDSPNGIEAAKRAGMKCVALTTSTSRERLSGADLVVDSYSEIDFAKF